MPVTIEDKIELFRKMLFGDIEMSSSVKKESLLADFESKKEQLKKDMELKQAEIIDEAVKKSEKEKQQLLSKVITEEHHKILKKQQEYVEQILQLLKDKTIEYSKSLEYRNVYLSRNIENACKDFEDIDNAVFYFTESDIQQFEDFINTSLLKYRKGKSFEIKQEEADILGGFIVRDKELIMQADYTLVTLIEESRDMIGINISRMFDEVMN